MDNSAFEIMDGMSGIRAASEQNRKEELVKIKKEEKQNQSKNGRSRMTSRVKIPGTNKDVRMSFVGPVATAGMLAAAGVFGGKTADANIFRGNDDPGLKIETVEKVSENTEVQTQNENQLYKNIMEVVPDDPEKHMRENAAVSIPLLMDAFKNENIDSDELIAFCLANVEHESWFDYKKDEIDGDAQATDLNYEGGIPGMGLIQATGTGNLRMLSEYLRERFPEKFKGLDFVKTPERQKEPEISAAEAVAFMKLNGIEELLKERNYVEARKRVVGRYADTDTLNIRVEKYIELQYHAYLDALKKDRAYQQEVKEKKFSASINARLDHLLAK